MLSSKNGFSRLASRLAWRFAAPVALCAGLLASAPASAATMTQVPSGWQVGTEPSWVSMYWYVPDNLPANAPVIVLVHYCSGNAAGIFGEAQSGGIITQADQKKILLVVPQTSRNCWDVATANSLKHDAANNDTKAIVDMTKYAIAQKQANANRVYVMGASSGAMVTQAMHRDVSRRVQGRRRVRGRSRGMLGGRQHDRRAVELVVRERPGPAHPAGVGRHRARHVPRVHRISPPHPALARVGGHHHQLRQLHRGRRAVDQRAGAVRDADDDGDPVDRRPQLQPQAMERLLRDHRARRI